MCDMSSPRILTQEDAVRVRTSRVEGHVVMFGAEDVVVPNRAGSQKSEIRVYPAGEASSDMDERKIERIKLETLETCPDMICLSNGVGRDLRKSCRQRETRLQGKGRFAVALQEKAPERGREQGLLKTLYECQGVGLGLFHTRQGPTQNFQGLFDELRALENCSGSARSRERIDSKNSAFIVAPRLPFKRHISNGRGVFVYGLQLEQLKRACQTAAAGGIWILLEFQRRVECKWEEDALFGSKAKNQIGDRK
ncbi:hypothetical protein C8J57DRAFT_1616657 [Mycena rebaudengoi]|nr:hypothetical protein C8J57DRAFT_1616657 [Mycena rebaudengoi]